MFDHELQRLGRTCFRSRKALASTYIPLYTLVYYCLYIGYLFQKLGNKTPKLTYVICGKRHHVRFFPNDDRDRSVVDKSKNFGSGLVVDDGVVHPVFRDFYLQSQKPLQGTSRPAHYTVLWDDNGLTMTE